MQIKYIKRKFNPFYPDNKSPTGFVVPEANKKNMCVSDCMVFKIRVGRSGFFFFFKPTSVLLSLKSHKLVSFFLTTAY
jgi:hypothetical protein